MPRQIKHFSIGIFLFLSTVLPLLSIYLVLRDHGAGAFVCQPDCGASIIVWQFVGWAALMSAGIGALAVVLLAPILWLKIRLKPS